MSHLMWYPGQEILRADIVRAEGCHLYDSAGRRCVDLESGVWCTSIGHNHPRVRQALLEQWGAIGHTGFNYTSGIVEEVAGVVLELLGFAEGRCVFLCSGSEAVEYGVRVAQAVSRPGRPLLLTMADSYFGAYGSASRKQESEWFCFDWTGCAACGESRMCSDCPAWTSVPFERLSGFLFEPGSSSGLVRFPPKKLIVAIARRVQEEGGLVLVNEVTTGIGRTGAWFGFQHYQIRPDIVGLGKGIGNGYPVSVTAFSAAAASRLEGPARYAQSHQNDPLGAAVIREVLRIIREEGLIERGRETGALLLAGLRALQDRGRGIREVRGRGLMMVAELEDPASAAGHPRAVRVHRELLERGFVVGRRPDTDVLRLDPPLTLERADADRFLATLDDVLSAH